MKEESFIGLCFVRPSLSLRVKQVLMEPLEGRERGGILAEMVTMVLRVLWETEVTMGPKVKTAILAVQVQRERRDQMEAKVSSNFVPYV